MAADAQTVKALRDRTGAGVMDCKAALQASQGDLDGAVEYLRKKGLADAQKRQHRETKEGVVASYIHGAVAPGLGRIGVLVGLKSTGDKGKVMAIGRQVAMHIAAASPLAVRPEEIEPALLERERAVYREQAKESGKPEAIVEKMVEGRVRKYYEEVVLLSQGFVVNPELKVPCYEVRVEDGEVLVKLA